MRGKYAGTILVYMTSPKSIDDRRDPTCRDAWALIESQIISSTIDVRHLVDNAPHTANSPFQRHDERDNEESKETKVTARRAILVPAQS